VHTGVATQSNFERFHAALSQLVNSSTTDRPLSRLVIVFDRLTDGLTAFILRTHSTQVGSLDRAYRLSSFDAQTQFLVAEFNALTTQDNDVIYRSSYCLLQHS